MPSHASPGDAYGYLSWAEREGIINGYERLRKGKRIYWKIETISTRYDNFHGIKWVPIVLTTREVFIFIEGCYAARGFHPSNRVGAYNAGWEANHVTPSLLSRERN